MTDRHESDLESD